MNANKTTLGGPKSGDEQDQLQERRFNNLKSKLGDTFPDDPIEQSDITDEGLARILGLAVKKSVLKGVEGCPGLTAIPVAQFRYSDGHHQMFTSTIVLWDEQKVSALKRKARLADWPYAAQSWDSVQHIAISDLSWKERIALNELLSLIHI